LSFTAAVLSGSLEVSGLSAEKNMQTRCFCAEYENAFRNLGQQDRHIPANHLIERPHLPSYLRRVFVGFMPPSKSKMPKLASKEKRKNV